MKDKKKRDKIHIATPDEVGEFAEPETPAETTDGAGEQEAPVKGTQSDGSEAAAESRPETELERAVRERDEFKDKWLRGKADAQNQARRLRADRDEAVRFAVAGLARSLLNVVDDLDRTIQAAEESGEADSLTKGVRIVYDAVLKVLGDHHVERIEALGQPFDPQYHEAITQQPSADVSAGTVLQEIQAGYRLHERVLRPARVIVSCEPPADDESASDEPDDGEEEGMPTYDYECAACGHRFDAFQSITARPLKKCPECGERALQRLIGTGAGIIFKGSGFYQTDYRSEEYKKAAKAEKEARSGTGKKSDDKKDTKKTDKPAAKTEKPPAKAKKSSAA